jgi:hypothetical protein
VWATHTAPTTFLAASMSMGCDKCFAAAGRQDLHGLQ